MFYKKAILIAPDYVEAYLNSGAVYRTQGSYEDAIGEYKEAIRIDPDDAMAHYNLGDIYYKQGEIDQAIFQFKEVVRITPQDTKVHNILACLFSVNNQEFLAIESLRNAIQLDMNFRESAKTNVLFSDIRKNSKFQELIQ